MNVSDSKRDYSSPLRERLAQETRQLIFEGAIRLMENGSEEELTIAAVAKVAGVSERTVYRHFPSKEELLEASWRWSRERMGFGTFPKNPDELVEMLPRVYDSFAKHGKLMHGYLYSQAGRRMQCEMEPLRQAGISASLAEVTAGLSAADIRNAEAVIQLLYSGRGWSGMCENWGLTSAEAAQAATWAVQVLVRELRALQQAAADGRG